MAVRKTMMAGIGLLSAMFSSAALAQGTVAGCTRDPRYFGCLAPAAGLSRGNTMPLAQGDSARSASIAQILSLIAPSDISAAVAALGGGGGGAALTGTVAIGADKSNFVTINGNPSGYGPIIAAAGANDTNVSLVLQGKGAGSVYANAPVYATQGMNVAAGGLKVQGAGGPRGPLFILNDFDALSSQAGQAAGAQIWVGNNPTGTPGPGDTIGLSMFVTSSSRRAQLWGADIGVVQDGSPGTLDGLTRILELETSVAKSFEPDAFTGNHKNGIELIGMAGGQFRPTAAIMTWANDSTGKLWWNRGIVMSRVGDTGIRFEKNPGGGSDTAQAFAYAAIHDASDSSRVIKVDGAHSIFADLSEATAIGVFVKANVTAATNLAISNAGSNFPLTLTLDGGGTVAQSVGINLSHNGAPVWRIEKNNGNYLAISNLVSGTLPLFISPDPTNPVAIWVGGASKIVQMGPADSAGAGYRALRINN